MIPCLLSLIPRVLIFYPAAVSEIQPAPSRQPTVQPTPQPSAPQAPTRPLIDCRSECSMSDTWTVTGGNAAYDLYLPKFFKFSFETRNAGLPVDAAGARRNILEIYDVSHSKSLLKISTTETRALKISYNGLPVVEYGVSMVGTYTTTYTTVVTWVNPLQLQTVTSADYNDVRAYALASNADTTGNIYTLMLSASNTNTAQGTVRNFVITGKHFSEAKYACAWCQVSYIILSYYGCIVPQPTQTCPQRCPRLSPPVIPHWQYSTASSTVLCKVTLACQFIKATSSASCVFPRTSA